METNNTGSVEVLRAVLKAALSSGSSRRIEDAAADLAAGEVIATEETEALLYEAVSFLESLLRLRQRRGASVVSIRAVQTRIQAVKGVR